jgi:hypothetical protein
LRVASGRGSGRASDDYIRRCGRREGNRLAREDLDEDLHALKMG